MKAWRPRGRIFERSASTTASVHTNAVLPHVCTRGSRRRPALDNLGASAVDIQLQPDENGDTPYQECAMPSPPRVVQFADATVSKSWGGDLKFSYPCPKCGDNLTSTNDEVLRQDECPSCGRAFVFDEPSKQAWYSHEAERQEAERQKAIEQKRKEEEREQRRLANEAREKKEEELRQQQVAEWRAQRDAEKRRSKTQTKGLEATKSFIGTLVGIGVLGCLAVIGVGFLISANMGNGLIGFAAMVFTAPVLIGLLIFNSFFKCLFAINENLERIHKAQLEGQGQR